MIAVIADDFTGAAELAGISLRYGLKTADRFANEVVASDADVLIVCTDSRSLSKEEAINTTEQYCDRCFEIRTISLFIKKLILFYVVM